MMLLLIFLKFSLILAQHFDSCDKVENVTVTTPFVFISDNYTENNYNKKYAPGSACRVLCIAPEGYYLHARGSINLDRKPGVFECPGQSETFMISREGLLDFYNGELACTTATINVNSVFNLMTIGYLSEDDDRRAGRFKVTVSAVPLDQRNCDCGWGLHVSENFFINLKILMIFF